MMGLLQNIHSLFSRDDREQLWRQFAAGHHGTYAPASDEGAVISHNGFMMTFDAYTHYTIVGSNCYDSFFTRGIAEFRCNDNFRLLLTKQDFTDNIGKFFGVQDIETGDREFDKKFMVKSNDEPKTIAFLAGSSIKTSLLQQPIVRFAVTDEEGLWGEKPKEDHCMLYCVVEGQAIHARQLNVLHRLFVEAIDLLSKQYDIQPQEPGGLQA